MHLHAGTRSTPTRKSPGSASAGSAWLWGKHSNSAVLTLQRSAGNKAVGVYLQRDPATQESAPRTSGVPVMISGLGAIEALSVSFPNAAGSVSGTAGARAAKPTAEVMREVSLYLAASAASAKLMQAAATGQVFESVIIELRWGRIVLSHVIVSSDVVSAARGEAPASESITLVATDAHVEDPPKPDAISGA